MPTRLQLAREDIAGHFDAMAQPILTQREIARILTDNRDGWRLAGTTLNEFLEYLTKNLRLKQVVIPLPSRRETRYTWGEIPLEPVLSTLRPSCYFSHYTAAQMHDLTEQDPRSYYVNHEQSPKPKSELGLTQERIDAAFARQPRRTKNIATIKPRKQRTVRINLLNGQFTAQLGVEERQMQLPERRVATIRLTDIERTLVDIVVRPFYAGGVAEVLKMYGRAQKRASINRLVAILRKLGFAYPYHQAVGYYLEASGHDHKAVDLFQTSFSYEFDFHLDYGMQETEFVQKWRIHVPRGFTTAMR